MSNLLDPEILRTVLDNLQTGVCLTDREQKIRFWNEGAERITGYHRHEVVGHLWRENVLPQCDGHACAFCGATCPFIPAVLNGKSLETKIDLRHKDGHRMPVRLWMVPIRDGHGSIIGTAQSFDRQAQISERRRQQSLAMYGCLDQITEIPNHSFTEFHLRESIASFTEYHLPFGVMVIEVDALDHFRSSYGREAADAILHVVAQTLKDALRPTDFLGRWGETQFLAILLNSTNSGVTSAAERIRRLVRCAGLQWWGDQLKVNTFLGHATVQGGDSTELLLERARQSLERSRTKLASSSATQSASSGR